MIPLPGLEPPNTFSAKTTARLIEHFHEDMRRGLAGHPRSISMQPSFVSRPSGHERGRFVALDLGGTNVRVTVVDMAGDGATRVLSSDSFRLPTTDGDASDLFDPVAEFLGGVLDEGTNYSLGFIFAFPIQQLGVRSGRLTKWTKEFTFRGVEGREVVALLQDAVDRRSSSFPSLSGVRVSALANDTVGVLAAGSYLDPRCDMGLIVGTGTNLAVAMPMERIGRNVETPAGNPNEMLINMECGNFDGVRSIQTEYDRQLDAGSDTDGQMIEKMISGRYIGEIVRLQVADLDGRGDAFAGWCSEASAFGVPYAFTTEHLSDILYDSSKGLTSVGMVLSQLGVPDTNLRDRRRLYHICSSVAVRSAWLVAVSIVATARYIDPDLAGEHLVAVDGSVFRGIPGYQAQVEGAISAILGDRVDRIGVSYLRDGSGLGAAVVAAVADEDHTLGV